MEQGLPADLDDGELWLPSDIFPNDEAHYTNNHVHNHGHDNNYSYNQVHRDCQIVGNGSFLDDLSRRFTHLNVHNHHVRTSTSTTQPPNVTPYSQFGMFGPKTQYPITTPATNGCYGLTVEPTFDRGLFTIPQTGPDYPTADGQALYHGLLKPVHPLVAEQLMETRMVSSTNTRPVHGSHSWLMHQPIRNCRGPASGTGGLVHQPVLQPMHQPIRKSRGPASGTGVFIPCATSNSRTIRYDGTRRNSAGGFGTGRGPAKTPSIERAQDYHCHHKVPSSQVALPKDWSYC